MSPAIEPAIGMPMDFAYLGTILLLIFGFGFVIFWHELGHFLAAKWAGVKVEQFAVGFGQALLSWRKGLGLRTGSSFKEYERTIDEYLARQETTATDLKDRSACRTTDQIEQAAGQLGLGETEYRLNWIPLGGYVKMLGQDDMNPNAQSDSPRAYNNKSIGKRMVIVSAGVIMNVILAIILFAALFRIGFDVPPPVVGTVLPLSPAQQAGVQVGDTIRYFDGRYQHDFTKISLNTALVEEGDPVPMVVQHPDGSFATLTVVPRRDPLDPSGFLKLGISQSPELIGLDPSKLSKGWDKDRDLLPPDVFAIKPGERIVGINGQPIGPEQYKDYYKLDRAVQVSFGRPVTLTVADPGGKTREVQLHPGFVDPFGDAQLNFAGLVPRAAISTVLEDSSARGKIMPGDVVVSMTVRGTNDTFANPSRRELFERLKLASSNEQQIDMVVLRDGRQITVSGLSTQTRLETGATGSRGLGVGPGYDADHLVIADVLSGSPASQAKVPVGATLVSVNGQPVNTWYEVHRVLSQLKAPRTIQMVVETAAGLRTFDLGLSESDLSEVAAIRYTTFAALHELSQPRQTNNPLTATAWGIAETRDLMVQFYLTLRRMFQGSVPASGAMGPLGIFHQGSKIASRGTDWLIWFLAMISANLAVVNFLPIPIVDGGLFMFLIVEKIMRKPLSPRAQSIAQIVGLALIASVFLFVTYHDILRMF